MSCTWPRESHDARSRHKTRAVRDCRPAGRGRDGRGVPRAQPRPGSRVAIKVLPAAMANDAERMARFQREAQMLASLNHTNIASIYGLEESGGVRALVMELVEGR